MLVLMGVLAVFFLGEDACTEGDVVSSGVIPTEFSVVVISLLVVQTDAETSSA